MLTLNFYSCRDKLPEVGQSIVCFKRESSFGEDYFTPTTTVVEACWTLLEDGEDTGITIAYDPEDPALPYIQDGVVVSFRLDLSIDGYPVSDDWFWMPLDQYWAAFDAALTKD